MADVQQEGAALPATLQNIAVLIPAWQPGTSLLALVAELRRHGLAAVLVVDDGSTSAAQPIFSALRASGTAVLHHRFNRGKGRALKTGFAALISSYPGLTGIVTADADGQHRPEDIVRVAQVLAADPGRPVLGSRAFSGVVPLRSRLGNTLTRYLFSLVAGARLHDTQTGLRGLPAAAVPALLALPGERYEYEMAVLVHLYRTGAHPVAVPIRTVYLEGNQSSHFHPLWDSVRVSCVLAGFALERMWRFGRP